MKEERHISHSLDEKSLAALSKVKKLVRQDNTPEPKSIEVDYSPAVRTAEWYKKQAEINSTLKTEKLKGIVELKPIVQSIEEEKRGNDKTVYQIGTDGKIIKRWIGAVNVADKLNLTFAKFSEILKGPDRLHNGCYWIYQSDYKSTFDYKKEILHIKNVLRNPKAKVIVRSVDAPITKRGGKGLAKKKLTPEETEKIRQFILANGNKMTNEEMRLAQGVDNMQQAGRISDKTAFFYMGELLEYNDTKQIFTNPKHEKTQNYITGRFG